MQAMACGAFAEKVVAAQSQVVKIPESVPFASASLACGVITGVGAVVNAAALRPGQDVVVIGAGGVGLNAIQGARIAGARRIVAVDMSEEKLEIAKEFGATDGVWQRVTPRGVMRKRRLDAVQTQSLSPLASVPFMIRPPLFGIWRQGCYGGHAKIGRKLHL